MSMISSLVEKLRWIADYEYQSRNSEEIIRQAADVIEMLSEKAKGQIERDGEMMTLKQNITSILECHFSGFKDELIEACVQRIMEQIECQADTLQMERKNNEID